MATEDDPGGNPLMLPFCVALLLSGCIAWIYAERSMNVCAFLTTVLGFTVCLCTVALVPYDVWAAQVRIDAHNEGLPQESVKLPISPESVYDYWQAMYWMTVLMCYIVIPLLMEFESAGDFRFNARLKTSLRRNCAWYIVYIILGIIGLIFIPSEWLTADGVKMGRLSGFSGFCIAASNTFGLIILVMLMGFGLVGLPRNLWLASDQKGELRTLYSQVAEQNSARLAAQSELAEIIAEVAKEIAAVNGRMSEADERYIFANKVPMRAAISILQDTLDKSQEFHKKLVDNSCPERQPMSTSSASSLEPSSPASDAGLMGSFVGMVKSMTDPDARTLSSPKNSVSERRREIRDRRQEIESIPLAGLLSPALEAPSLSSAAEAQPLSPRPGINGRRPSAELLLDMGRLAGLHTALKFVTLEARRASHHWDTLVQKCSLIEDLENLQPESTTDTPGSQWSVRRQLYEASWSYTRSSPLCCSGCCRRLLREHYFLRDGWRRFVMFWYRVLRPRALKFASCFTGTLSALIVLGQLTMFSKYLQFLSIFGVLVNWDNSYWATHFFCLVPLSYMAFTASWGIFRLRISGWYGLYPDHNTDSSSLLWCTMALTRISVPLCYHFLGVLHITERTSFEDFMQPMQIVPVLGKDFNRYFPVFVALLCACNVAGIYSGMVRKMGLGWLDLMETAYGQNDTDPMEEGKELIQRERRRRFETGVQELQRHGEAPEVLCSFARHSEPGGSPAASFTARE